MGHEAEAKAAADAFTSAWLARDLDRLAETLAEDFTFWTNCSKLEMDRGGAIGLFGSLAALTSGNQYYDIQQHFTPTGLVQQHLCAFEAASGAFKDIPLMLIFTTCGPQVSRCEAYLDSTGLPQLGWPQGTVFF